MLNKGLLGLGALLVAALSALWLVDFEANELGGLALDQASASTGIRLEASRYRLNVLRGLELDDVEASARVPGGSYTITIPTMRFEHRWLSLIRGPIDVERVVVTEPRVAIITGLDPVVPTPPRRRAPRGRRPGPPSQTPPAAEPPVPSIELRVDELELREAVFSLNDDVALDGVTLSLESPTLASRRLTLLHAVTANGRISIRQISLGTLTVGGVSAVLGLSDGRLELRDGVFEIERGSFGADVQLDLNTIPARYRLSLTGRLTGVPGEVSFDGEGFGLVAMNLKGDGRWTVPAGRFDDAPLWRSLELTGSAYEATEISFAVAEGQLELDGVWIRGTVGLEGALDLVVSGKEVTGTWDAPVVK